jgi:hypothetical protein
MMAVHKSNSHLNDVLIALHRSLVQYVGDCWPWTATEADAVRDAVGRLVERQREHVSRLVDVLVRRDWPVDFGMFPVEFTDLHYVALGYLLDQLVADQKSVVARIEQSRRACAGDAAAAELLDSVLAAERQTLARLEELSKVRVAGTAA